MKKEKMEKGATSNRRANGLVRLRTGRATTSTVTYVEPEHEIYETTVDREGDTVSWSNGTIQDVLRYELLHS